MTHMTYIIAAIVLLLLIVLILLRRKNGMKPNYRALFIIGICWIPLGIATENMAFTAVGAIMTVFGLFNKSKWKQERKWSELTETEKKIKLILIAILSILIIAGIVLMILNI